MARLASTHLTWTASCRGPGVQVCHPGGGKRVSFRGCDRVETVLGSLGRALCWDARRCEDKDSAVVEDFCRTCSSSAIMRFLVHFP